FLFPLTERFWLAAGFIFLVSLSLLSVQVGSNSLLQTIARPDMRGRTISMSSSVSVGGPALGALVMGFLAERFGLQTVLGIAAVAGTLLYIAMAPALLRRRRNMEQDQHRQIDVAPAS
ncbi:MAG: MFS transporter, partial [Rhodospirillaceae bacterium]|nr:MFS transporter [Rhodospirillaceae bacterium]